MFSVQILTDFAQQQPQKLNHNKALIINRHEDVQIENTSCINQRQSKNQVTQPTSHEQSHRNTYERFSNSPNFACNTRYDILQTHTRLIIRRVQRGAAAPGHYTIIYAALRARHLTKTTKLTKKVQSPLFPYQPLSLSSIFCRKFLYTQFQTVTNKTCIQVPEQYKHRFLPHSQSFPFMKVESTKISTSSAGIGRSRRP